ncbi:MAG: alpha/beta fold hydrolase [Myxococcales bacterium]|nr:alpha/beta fold hydrolase [Myxococcales bacterium]
MHTAVRTEVHWIRGCRYCLTVVGDGPRDALLLHGFPDAPANMMGLAHGLAQRGWRVAVPYLRGYGLSESSPGADLSLAGLAADVGELLDALGFQHTLLVGHDWGSAVAQAAADGPRVAGVALLSVPPIPWLIAGLPRDPGQLRRSAYMGAFQVPGAVRALQATGGTYVDRLWRSWSPRFQASEAQLAAARRALAPPGALATALGYYRALWPRRPARWRASLAITNRPLPVPALVLGGTDDACIGPGFFRGDPTAAFAQRHQVTLIEGAGHFLPVEAPRAVLAAIDAFFGRPEGAQ